MINILITGSNSYIGTNIEKRMLKEKTKYNVETLDMRNIDWKNHDFKEYDVVFHVAGIAHVSYKKKMIPLYNQVNRDLAIETAIKAKKSGVKQFIFMSSIIIYGKDNRIGKFENININNYNPINAYGLSKLEADLEIQKMSDEIFITSIVRSPIVYGEGSKGNFPKLKQMALKLPVIPKIKNQRSMIHIDNLSEFIYQVIKNRKQGVFYPQNREFMSSYEIMKITREKSGKKVRSTKVFNWMFKLSSFFCKTINKIYGNKTYALEQSKYDFEYIVYENEQTI